MDRLREQADGEELLRLALATPEDALARASTILETDTDPFPLSFARQAVGIILRDRGQTAAAIIELRRALELAQDCGRAERTADVRATLGAALVMHGQTRAGLAELDAAASEAHGRLRATVLMRRAYVLSFLGRPRDALRDLRAALAGLRRAGDSLWEARTLNNRGNLLMTLGEVDRAERDVRRAEQMFLAAGEQLEAVRALHNRADLAHLHGDLPRAFALYDRAAVMYESLGAESADLVLDRCQAYLVAGLSGDAGALANKALEGPLQPRHRAEVRLMLATAALAHGEPETAVRAARAARLGFTKQDRPFWVTRAELVLAQAEYLSGRRRRGQVQRVRRLAHQLRDARAEEAPVALLLAGRLAVEAGADGSADLQAAARFRRSHSPQVRATGWLALALDRDLARDRRGVLFAARRGLDTLAAQRDVLGSTQLRALATRNTAELTTLALRHVLASGNARELLMWSERARAAALATPAVRPPHDPVLAGQLAAMRAVARALDQARERGTPTAELVARLARLEASIDQRRHRAGATDAGETGPHPPDPASFVGAGPEATGPVDTGPHRTGSMGTGPHARGLNGTGPDATGPVVTGAHSVDPMGPGPHARGLNGTGPDATGPVDTGAHSVDPMGPGRHRTGRIEGCGDSVGESPELSGMDHLGVEGGSPRASPDSRQAVSPHRRGLGPASLAATPAARQAVPRRRGAPLHRAAAFDRDDLARIAERLGDRILVELVDVDDVLHAVVVLRGRARRATVGPTPAALAAVQRARFALRQLARGRSADLVGAAGQLERALLGETVSLLGDDPVVLVPPARLHHAPWALCPALAAGPLTASPSAARWMAALDSASSTPPGVRTPPTALIAGPGLAGADAEVSELAAQHPGAVVLRGPSATVPATLHAFGEAAVVHIAAHGRHRADNPLFSSLQLADGPLTVHDLESVARMPGRIVLSACDSAVMTAVGSDALLGLAEALLAQGTAGVVCAVSEVNDAATRPVMTRVHAALAAGRTPAEALLAARDAARGDLLATATAASFTSLGA